MRYRLSTDLFSGRAGSLVAIHQHLLWNHSFYLISSARLPPMNTFISIHFYLQVFIMGAGVVTPHWIIINTITRHNSFISTYYLLLRIFLAVYIIIRNRVKIIILRYIYIAICCILLNTILKLDSAIHLRLLHIDHIRIKLRVFLFMEVLIEGWCLGPTIIIHIHIY